ncbi:MAG: threonine synthase [Bacteroidetes bacterium]|nr:MAG: threonine synthase [Bacteroidota bacterium]
MKFKSVLEQSSPVDFREALCSGIAPDGSLYVPELLPSLSVEFISSLPEKSFQEIVVKTLSLFLEEMPGEALERIVRQSLTFPIPLVRLEEHLFLLELFRGPTLAFKDVGARFMAQALSYYLGQEERETTILVATSGDTGSAVAHGFFNVSHITVYVLYPSGKISRLQEQQMTTLGGNIRAIEVEGTFDDCQKLVKQSLADRELVNARNLTTANSINIGRLLPQITYYVWAMAQWQKQFKQNDEKPVVVVPSGNFGNLTAAVYAKWIGTPIKGFLAATNANDVVPEYFQAGVFTPRSSVQTYSNAMDVGNPSNLARLQALYRFDVQKMKNDIQAISITDTQTLEEIKRTYERTGHVIDPHTAVGVAAARAMNIKAPTIIASTAHPAKFQEVIQLALGKEVPLPVQLQEALDKQKLSVKIPADFTVWRKALLADATTR